MAFRNFYDSCKAALAQIYSCSISREVSSQMEQTNAFLCSFEKDVQTLCVVKGKTDLKWSKISIKNNQKFISDHIYSFDRV